MFQWLKLHALTAGGTGIILNAMGHNPLSKKKKKKTKENLRMLKRKLMI